jgi:hypothetical protein
MRCLVFVVVVPKCFCPTASELPLTILLEGAGSGENLFCIAYFCMFTSGRFLLNDPLRAILFFGAGQGFAAGARYELDKMKEKLSSGKY